MPTLPRIGSFHVSTGAAVIDHLGSEAVDASVRDEILLGANCDHAQL